MDKDFREYKMNELIDQVIESKISYKYFYFALLGNMHTFYDGNGRTCKILFYLQLKLCFI